MLKNADMVSIKKRIASTLEELGDEKHSWIKSLDSYKYLSHSVSNKQNIEKTIQTMLHDVRHVQNMIAGKIIVDAGCGAGVFSVFLSLLGAKKVYAVDYLSDCIDITRVVVKVAGVENVHVICSDIGTLDLQEDVDGIFSIEAISHYRDYKSFIKTAARLLRGAGFLVVRDGNNGASSQTRKKTQAIWDVFERCSEPSVIYGHVKGQTCYHQKRRDIIADAFPFLAATDVDKYAAYTFAFSKDMTVKAVSRFIQGDFSLKSEYCKGRCPLDPESDCYMEYIFNPKDLAHEIGSAGFSVKVRSSGPSNSRLNLIRWIWEALSPVTIFSPRGYQLVAIRKR